MWKSFVLIGISIPLAFLALLIFWIAYSWRAGFIAGASVLALCLIAATLMIFVVKTISLVDVFLPLVFSVVWSVLLIPLSLGEEIFTAPTAIGSGFLLTLCLWMVYHNNGKGKNWLIFPIIVYIYEMLPVNIPGPFDDYFAFGGDVVCTLLLYSTGVFTRQLPGE
jgi:hypothetical protein